MKKITFLLAIVAGLVIGLALTIAVARNYPVLHPLVAVVAGSGIVLLCRTLRSQPAVRLWLLLIPLLFTGCVSLKGIAKVVESAGTKDKEIDTEFSGWNANWKYKSKPVQWRAPSTNSVPQESWSIVPQTTIRVEKN